MGDTHDPRREAMRRGRKRVWETHMIRGGRPREEGESLGDTHDPRREAMRRGRKRVWETHMI